MTLDDISTAIMLSFDPPWVLFLLLFIPYLLLGVYILQQRLGRHEEFRPSVEAAMLAGVVVFFTVQYLLLNAWLGRSPLKMFFATAGLSISVLALYGHLGISLVSHALLDMVMPESKSHLAQPRYGVAEACERQGDFEGAVREYRAISQMFPKDATSALRLADNLLKAGRSEEAAQHFERALSLLDNEDRALSVAFRLTDLYNRDLHKPSQAQHVLESYLQRFPAAGRADAVRTRLERMTAMHAAD